MSGTSETVNWVLNNSVEDGNYDSAVKKLTDAELIYCYKQETRKSSKEKLAAEARRRGMDWLVRDQEPGANGAVGEEVPARPRQLSIFGEFLPKKEEPKKDSLKPPKRAAPVGQSAAVAPVSQEPPKDRAWLVCYAGHRIEIEDPSGLSLDELRKRLERDFPELSAERVTWHWVPPNEEPAAGEQGENGEAGAGETQEAGAPGAAGQKEPLILVPVVTAGKKGSGDPVSRAVKGFFWSLAEALDDPRPVAVLAAGDGRLYEIRKTPAGIFSRALEEVPELGPWKEGFVLALPKVPAALLEEAMAFFRAALPNEALLQVLWDAAAGVYRLGLPEQDASPVRVDYGRGLLPDGLVWVMDVHSHGRLPAYFSVQDDRDERATGLYCVVGRVHTPCPELKVRYSCGGTYREVPPEQVFDLGG